MLDIKLTSPQAIRVLELRRLWCIPSIHECADMLIRWHLFQRSKPALGLVEARDRLDKLDEKLRVRLVNTALKLDDEVLNVHALGRQ